MTQEFYISVTPVGEDGYLVRTERVSPGVPLAEEFVTWKVEEWLAEASQLMHDPLLGLLRGNLLSLGRKNRSGQTDSNEAALSPNLVEFGQKLYNSLFQGTIRDSWMTAQGIAQNRREELRLRVGLKGDRLPRLPWEVLHAGDRPLATGTDVVFSRYQSAFAPMATVLQTQRSPVSDQNPTLRILMVLAAPTDQEVLALKEEANHLKDELQRSQPGKSLPTIELTILEQPGREQLTQALEQGRYQVLHYAGHSNLGASGGDLYLVSARTGLTEVLSGDDLAGLLVNNGIHMAVFNSCRGVYTATSDPDAVADAGNLTEALLKRGVPAVLAMAERIPDDVALTLSRLFYRNLKQRYPIDLSLSRARQGLLSAYGSNQLYWALPILYLHPDFDGYLQAQAADLNLLDSEDILDDIHFDDPEYEADQQTVKDLFDGLIHPSPIGDAAADSAIINPLNPELNPELEDLFSTADRSDSDALDPEIPSVNADSSAEDYITLGQLWYEQGNTDGAIVAYGEALRLDPDSAEAFYQMGIALERYGSIPEATIAYMKAVELDPSRESAQQNLRCLQTGTESPAQTPTVATLSSNPVTSGPSTPVDRIFAPPRQPTRQRPRIAVGLRGVLIGSVSAVALGVGIWGISRAVTPKPDNLLPKLDALTQTPTPSATATLNKDDTNNVTAIASKSFSQGNLRVGQQAVESLLDRGALPAAETALASVPSDQLDTPAISFLRGRLVWQSIKVGNRNYSPEDARRYWETAAKGKPDPLYSNALGFAYYAEGNLERATDAWFQSLMLVEEQKKNQGKTDAPSQDALTAYAGLALASMKSASIQSAARQTRLRGEAVKLRDRVLKASPETFKAGTLSRSWLWSETAIVDWRALQAVK